MGPRSSVLTIESISGEHAGNFTCVAKNQAGTATHFSTLIVNGLNKKYTFYNLKTSTIISSYFFLF